jgi:hypothetical protein
MEPVVLSPDSERRIAEHLHALLTVQPPAPKETYSVADLHVVLGCDSDSAVYRTLEKLRVRPYAPGKYRVADVKNGMAKAALRARQAAGYVDEKGREVAA